MKKIFLAISLMVILCPFSFAGEDSGSRASTNMRRADYPQILDDNRVVFQVQAPDAKKVQIDLGGKYDLTKDEKDMWSVTTDPITGGFHYYSLLIDGLALADPASESFYGMGRMASGIEIPYKGRDYYALRDVSHGDVRRERFYSPQEKAWRQLYIYTPPGYDESQKKSYPVLYLLHGGGEDERGWSNQGKADLILDNLIAEKKARPMLIVMLDGNFNKASFGEEGLKLLEAELKLSVIPFVEKNYRVKANASNRALAGLSMGGLQTLYAGVANTDMFAYLGVFSSGWITPMQDELAQRQYAFMETNKKLINNNLKTFWISMGGEEDIAHNNCQVMLAKFDEIGIEYRYSSSAGGHSWPVWRHDLYNFAPLLFK